MSQQHLTYSPFDPEVIADPYPIYRQLRDHAPAYWSPGASSWVLSRYHDVCAALTDPATYSSASGIFPTPPGVDMTELFLPMLIMSDPPRHTQMRQLVSKAFTPRRMTELESSIQTVIDDLLDQIPDTGPWDFVSGFAGPLPAIVIADMLGVPREDRDQFRTWSTALIQSNPAHGEFGPGLAAAAALYEYFAGFLAERRAHPEDDLMTALVQAEAEGQHLSEEELLGFCLLLLVAGHETTTNLLSNSAVLLGHHPETRQKLADNPDLVPAAVEELLRYDSPVQGLARTLSRPVDLHGQHMQSGDTVLLLYGSANRDHRAFPNADHFDINRRPERQVAFGRGPHFCLGAALARMETRIALNALLKKRLFNWDIDLPGAQRLHSGPIRGFASLPVQ
ncbi:cytochrome P450 [Nocardioides sp.]|uniref:cytochrome P450 n=1 Tax=Nocardioides sp. TaxID=35761 RepID=UPI002625ABE3|nr:cytochrome P450 [Nocardioides sp.]MDI6912551.1 cytochrome P450 [Nocardioides sp.]